MEMNRCLACRKQCHSIGEFVNDVKNPNHDKQIISSYSKYVDTPKKIIDFIEYNKNIIAKAGTLRDSPDPMAITMAEMMIYNILTTKPADVIRELY